MRQSDPPFEFKGGRDEDIQQWLSPLKDYFDISSVRG